MARIGVRDLYVHELTTESDTEATYGEPKRVAGLIEIGVSPQTDTAELYADDSLYESVSSLSGYDININVADLTPEQQGLLLGQEVNDSGMVFSSTDLNPPVFGVSFRAERTDGSFEYRQMFKVRFAPSDDNYNTKGDSIDFQTAEITGTAMPLKHNRLFDVRVLGDESNTAIISKWNEQMFTDVDTVAGP